ncbi:MAG: hypothetical protein GY796_07535 [Chloroflexi bacterium]|nr:hypothetical protein [Chloroflexota bacterium]
MRRIVLLLIPVLLLGLALLAAAQEAAVDKNEQSIYAPPLQLPPGAQSVWLTPIDAPQQDASPFAPLADGGDSCDNATDFAYTNQPIGAQTQNVETFTESSSDPVLDCIWGAPARNRGYRTVWYEFTAVTNGLVNISTQTSNYDTVVGVFIGSCSSLTAIACNDDFIGFSSRLSFSVLQGVTYYVVTADWNQGVSGDTSLNIFIEPQPILSQWTLANSLAPGRTHHATVSDNNTMFLIGGQPNAAGSPQLSNSLHRYYAASNTWEERTQMPGLGVTNVSAVYLKGKIYVPGGDNNALNGFDRTHYVYDVNNDAWSFSNLSCTSGPECAPVATDVGAVGPVGWAAAVPTNDDSGYYLIGGITAPLGTSNAQVISNTWKYNLAQDSWLPAPALNIGRFGHTGARLGNSVCVVGGISPSSVLLGGGECLKPFSSWQTIPSLNIPRYGAGSAVDEDGRWYVFGGIRGNGTPVASTEVYDPNSTNPQWQIMNIPFDLVDPDTVLSRAFPRGEFIDNSLYVTGGHNTVDYVVSPLTQKLELPKESYFLPIILKPGYPDEDNTLATARSLSLNNWVGGDYEESTDFYNFYTFFINNSGTVTAKLRDIPSGSDYDLYLFNYNKLILGGSNNAGNLDETITLNSLPTGRYYILVERIVGQSDDSYYRLGVLK